MPITIGTYPILLSNTLSQNSTITQQPTPLASYPSNNPFGTQSQPIDTFNSTSNPTAPYPSAPSYSTIPDSDGIGKYIFLNLHRFVY